MNEQSLELIQRERDQKINKNIGSKIMNIGRNEHEKYLTSAYEDFKDRLCYKYLLTYDSSDFKLLENKLDMIPGNSGPLTLQFSCCIPCLWPLCKFQVENNHFALVIHKTSEGTRTEIYGPGYHLLSFFHRLQGVYSFHDSYPDNLIKSENGDFQIVRVNQGSIMSLECSGQNIILPPGIHKISDPLVMVNSISLDQFFIRIGPERWITVPDGYDGISINRGQIKILEGGKQHHLAHVGDKFVKMVPKILQTDKIPTDISGYLKSLDNDRTPNQGGNVYDPVQFLQTTTIEGAFISLDVMIFWNISDTLTAASQGMELLTETEDYQNLNQQKAIQDAFKNIANLRLTVIRIARNHLCALVSQCSISSKQQKENSTSVNDYAPDVKNTFEILTVLQNKDLQLRDSINKDLSQIGCKMKNICIYSVSPQKDIQIELDKQTKAKVDAKTAIIQMQNKLQTNLIEMKCKNDIEVQQAQANVQVIKTQAQADAESEMIRAKAHAESIITIAKARKEEAEELQKTQIAQDLEIIRVTGISGQQIFQGNSKNYVFGKNPKDMMKSLFSNLQK